MPVHDMKGGKEREKRREEVVGKVKRGRYLGFCFSVNDNHGSLVELIVCSNLQSIVEANYTLYRPLLVVLSDNCSLSKRTHLM